MERSCQTSAQNLNLIQIGASTEFHSILWLKSATISDCLELMPKMTRGTLAGGLSQCKHSAFDFILAAHHGAEAFKWQDSENRFGDLELLPLLSSRPRPKVTKLWLFLLLPPWLSGRLAGCAGLCEWWICEIPSFHNLRQFHSFTGDLIKDHMFGWKTLWLQATDLFSREHTWFTNQSRVGFSFVKKKHLGGGNSDIFLIFTPTNWRVIQFDEHIFQILLMEEIQHHLGFIKPCKSWDKLPISTGEPDFFHQQSHIPEVRDLLLGKEPDDLDLTLCLRDCPEEVECMDHVSGREGIVVTST